MAWCRSGDKSLPEPMLIRFLDAYTPLWGDGLIDNLHWKFKSIGIIQLALHFFTTENQYWKLKFISAERQTYRHGLAKRNSTFCSSLIILSVRSLNICENNLLIYRFDSNYPFLWNVSLHLMWCWIETGPRPWSLQHNLWITTFMDVLLQIDLIFY